MRISSTTRFPAPLQRTRPVSQPPKNAHPAVARSLDLWHRAVAANDLGELPAIIHPDAVFRSPMAFSPYQSAEALILALTNVNQVFQDFVYERQLAGDDGLDVVLEFRARVGDKKLKGIDFIRFNEQGQIMDFEVMIRPMSGLQALGNAMGQRVGGTLPSYKSKG